MILPQPIPNILLGFVRKFDEFGGFFRAGASGDVVFDGVAFDPATVEVVGIASSLVSQDNRQRL